MMSTMTPQRDRVARYVAARRGELELSRPALAGLARVSPKTIYNLETGGAWPQATTRGKVARALGWEADGLQVIHDGGEPTLLESEDEAEPESELPTLEEIAARQQALEEREEEREQEIAGLKEELRQLRGHERNSKAG